MPTIFKKRKINHERPNESNTKRAKKTLTETEQKFYIQEPKDRKALAKQAGFDYIDRYVGGPKEFEKVFATPEFKQFAAQFADPNVYVAPVARLHGGKGAYASKAFTYNGKPLPLGIYWGEITTTTPNDLSYLFGVGKLSVDARLKGNWCRFVNHSQNGYNVIAQYKSIILNGIRLPYIQYSLIKSVNEGDQLLFDYGDAYQFSHAKQLFLNPSDNAEGPAELWLKNQQAYEKNPITYGQLHSPSLQRLGFTSEYCYAPTFLRDLLDNPATLNHFLKNKSLDVDLPLLFTDNAGNFLSVDEQPGITALMVAANEGRVDALKALINKGAAVEQQQAFTGHTPLFYAIQSNADSKQKGEMVAYLLEHGARVTTQDAQGMTPLHWCVKQNDLSMLKLLFKKPSRDTLLALDRINSQQAFCPILLALKKNNKNILSFLIEEYDKSHPKKFFALNDSWFCTALPTAIKSNKRFDAEMLDLLMQKGLKNNDTALMKILPQLKEKGVLIQSNPKKTTTDLTFIFPDNKMQTYNVKQTSSLNRFLNPIAPNDKIATSQQKKRKSDSLTAASKTAFFKPATKENLFTKKPRHEAQRNARQTALKG